MDYKELIKSRSLRIKIMQALSFVPDEWMVSIQYRIKTGHRLNLKDPKRFTEKLQWYKLNYRDPLMQQCVDKYDVREYVKSCGLKSILNECYGVYNTPEEIDFDSLPNSFVLKDTLGGGGNSVILVENKNRLDWELTKKQMARWTSQPVKLKHPGREWVYDGRPHRIVVEKYIQSDPQKGGLVDYKFFCFDGKIYCVYVMTDRTAGLKMAVYDSEFRPMNAYISYDQKLQEVVPTPENYFEMCNIAQKLSSRFPHVRIDLYNQDGKIWFGETTFFDGSGYTLFEPDEFDYTMGEQFKIK